MLPALPQTILGVVVFLGASFLWPTDTTGGMLASMLIRAGAGLLILGGLATLLSPVMSAIGPILRTVNVALHRIVLFVADIALLAMVIIVSYAVTLRYVFNQGVGWAEEVPRLLVTLFAFIAMAMGVRDHIHIGVNIVYNLFPKDGKARRFMVFFADYVVLLCGLFMAYYGTLRCLQMSRVPGALPMTGLRTWITYVPIPLAGFIMSFDSILFLLGVIKREDLLYSEPEVDYVEEYEEQQKLSQEAEEAKA